MWHLLTPAYFQLVWLALSSTKFVHYVLSQTFGKNSPTSIPDYAAYPCIVDLRINSNRLTKIPDFYNTTLTKLSLSDNPLVCNNALCWIRMRPWFFDSPILTDTPICTSPAIVIGTPLMDVRPVHMECFKGKPVNRRQTRWLQYVCGKWVHRRITFCAGYGRVICCFLDLNWNFGIVDTFLHIPWNDEYYYNMLVEYNHRFQFQYT